MLRTEANAVVLRTDTNRALLMCVLRVYVCMCECVASISKRLETRNRICVCGFSTCSTRVSVLWRKVI